MADVPAVWQRVAPHLRCPVCHGAMRVSGRTLGCGRGHSVDVARQGYVNLARGPDPGTGDTAEMVAARSAVLADGVLDAVTVGVVAAIDRAADAPRSGLAVDVATGTGHHLAGVLDHCPGLDGLGLDLSVAGIRRAARAHPRAAAAVADVWRELPVADGAAVLVTSIFGPRRPAEILRVLAPGGILVVATPGPDHLAPLVDELGLLHVAAGKRERLSRDFAALAAAGTHAVRAVRTVRRPLVRDLALMGPSAHHVDRNLLAHRLDALPEQVEVTVSVEVSAWRAPG